MSSNAGMTGTELRTIPKSFTETQDPDKVDVVSGATWSYNIFRASLKEALSNAVK